MISERIARSLKKRQERDRLAQMTKNQADSNNSRRKKKIASPDSRSDTTDEEPHLVYNKIDKVVGIYKAFKGGRISREFEVQWERGPDGKKYRNTRLAEDLFECIGDLGYMHLCNFVDSKYLKDMHQYIKEIRDSKEQSSGIFREQQEEDKELKNIIKRSSKVGKKPVPREWRVQDDGEEEDTEVPDVPQKKKSRKSKHPKKGMPFVSHIQLIDQ